MEKKLSYEIFFEKTFNPIALYVIDKQSKKLTANDIRYLDVNPAYEKVNNVNRNNIIGKSFAEIWPEVEECWSEIIENCIKEKQVVHCESQSVNTDKYLEAIAFPISNSMAATIFLDRTELKKSQEELMRNEKKLLLYGAKLRELATQLTLNEERTRREIATDLHDRIGHSLLSQLFVLRKIKEEETLSPQALEKLEILITETEKMIAESRQLIFELSPSILLEVGLTPALEALADHLMSPRNIIWNVITRNFQKDYPVDDTVCIILYRMTRELLINVIKHSHATKVDIFLNGGAKVVQVVVEDNGLGMYEKFDNARKNKAGLGLFSIRERLLHIGGEMQIISNDKGTSISLIAPRVLSDDSPCTKEIENDH